MSTHEIEAEALRLPREQRAALAQHLIASLDEADEVDQAWADEAARRGARLQSGEDAPVPASAVFHAARPLSR